MGGSWFLLGEKLSESTPAGNPECPKREHPTSETKAEMHGKTWRRQEAVESLKDRGCGHTSPGHESTQTEWSMPRAIV